MVWGYLVQVINEFVNQLHESSYVLSVPHVSSTKPPLILQ